MPNLISPGIFRRTPGAAGLDSDVVDTLTDAEEALFTPLGSPRVTNIPELLPIVGDTPTDNGDLVSMVQISSIVTVDASSVVIEGLRDSHTACNGSTLVDFLHHVVLPADEVVFVDAVNSVLIRDEAGFTWVAIAAHIHGAANLTIVQTSCSVD